jgi:hypothetical protein
MKPAPFFVSADAAAGSGQVSAKPSLSLTIAPKPIYSTRPSRPASAEFTVNKPRIFLNDDGSSMSHGKSRLLALAPDVDFAAHCRAALAFPFPRIGTASLSVRDLACLSWAR